MTVTFTGRELAWIAPTSTKYGVATVTADGHKLRSVSLYRATAARRTVHVWSWQTSRKHTVTIKVGGSANVAIDGFTVVR